MSRSNLLTTIALVILAGGLTTLGFFQFKTNQSLSSLKNSAVGSGVSSVGSKDGLSVDILDEAPKPKTTTLSSDFDSETTGVADLQASVSALLERVEDLEKNSNKTTTVTATTAKQTFQKETLFLGSTTGTSRSWTNSGLEVIIDSSDYPSTVSIFFEAGLSIIGGEAAARIVNKTTGAIISNTEIFNGTNEVVWRTSAGFKPHHGKNTYVLQVRSSGGEVANVTGARLVVK